MRFLTQTAAPARPQPFFLRAVALFCVLLLGSMSAAQAAHLHGQWLPHSAAEVTQHAAGPAALAEDCCPLCAAMHLAMPVQMVHVSATAPLVSAQAPVAVARHVVSLWRFELFSRPPPSLLS